MPALNLATAAAHALAQQRQLVEALRSVVDGLLGYRITRSTAAEMLHAALSLRHRDQQLQQPPPSLECADGYCYGAVLERIAFDFAGSAPLARHIPCLTELANTLDAGLSAFHVTHRLYPNPKNHHDR